jgi:hypothetical protein
MAHKHTQKEIDAVLNQWRGKHAVEKMVAEYDGPKWSKYQRYRGWPTLCAFRKGWVRPSSRTLLADWRGRVEVESPMLL